MVIFTLKERRFIDDAIFQFGDDHERTVWRDWKLSHPEIRYDPNGPTDDGTPRMPSYVAEVLTSALARFERYLKTRIVSVETSDEEAALLCNDLGDIDSTTQVIRSAT